MLIRVEKDDIIRGTRGEETDCMVSRACQRQLGGIFYTNYDVVKKVAFTFSLKLLKNFKLPNEVYEKLEKWDNHKVVEPFSFRLDIG